MLHTLTLTLALVCTPPQDPPAPAAVDPQGQTAPKPEPMPIPQAGVFRLGEVRIVIDGALGDWPALPPLTIDDVRQVSGTALGSFRSLEDIAGRVFLCWDDDDLYVAAVVQDDWHIHLPKDREQVVEIPPADSVLLTFDPSRDTRAIGNDPGRREDTSFWLADVEGQGNRVVFWDRLRGEARFAQGAASIVSRDQERHLTTYEARLPWAEILPRDVKARAGLVIGAQIVIADYDEPTDPMPQTRLGWTFGIGPRIDPGVFGSLLLLSNTAESVSGRVRLPEIPSPTVQPEPPIPEAAYWVALANRIARSPLAFVEHDTADPAFVAGRETHELMAELDGRIAEFPRVDFLDFQHAIHRRMNRECAGIAGRGLPYFWDFVLDATLRRARATPPETGYVLWRLPQGGWLVRSKVANFAIDPAGYRVEDLLDQDLRFVLLTSPLDPTRRNDQLLTRAALSDPAPIVFTHIAINLPGVDVRSLPLAVPGGEYARDGITVRVCGKVGEDGLVARSVGYQVIWPDGTTLVISGIELLEETVDRDRGVDCLLLSAMHPYARSVGNRLDPKAIVIDDLFRCADLPGADGRAVIKDAFGLQNGLRPHRSVILMPGQSLEISGRGKTGGTRRDR